MSSLRLLFLVLSLLLVLHPFKIADSGRVARGGARGAYNITLGPGDDAGRLTFSRGGQTGASRQRLILADVPESAAATSHRVVQQTQIDLRDRPCCTHPAGVVRPACLVPRTHSGATCREPLLRSPITTPTPLPPLPPVSDCPVPTMPCYGTTRVIRVRVLECPPLGRPSLIKLVLVKSCAMHAEIGTMR
jgi:hypothetical protein